MIEWKTGEGLDLAPGRLEVIAKTHEVLEKQAGLGNVWSLESLRRWLKEAGDERIETVQKYVKILPEHLVRRFIAKEEQRRAGDGPAARHRLQPDPARGGEDRPRARRSAQAVPRLHHLRHRPAGDRRAQQRAHDPPAQRGAADLRGLRRPCCSPSPSARCSSGLVSLLPGLFPVVASGRHHLGHGRRARSSPRWWRCWWCSGSPSTRSSISSTA